MSFIHTADLEGGKAFFQVVQLGSMAPIMVSLHRRAVWPGVDGDAFVTVAEVREMCAILREYLKELDAGL